MPKVLISDKMSPLAQEIFEKNNIECDFKPGLSPEELKNIIAEYDGLAIRSATKATAEIIAAAKNLKVIGRAGIGVDNVDIPAATNAGIIVMNTPFGNSTTTAEHAIAMMFATARKIPQASSSTHLGKWEKSKFMGTELTGKTLGVIGCGNIGSIVIRKAQGLEMKVIGYDPFLTTERAEDLGIAKVELTDLFKQADFITLHVPLNDATKNIINAKAIEQMKKGVFIINCARGGLIDEAALKDALDSEQVAGAALDVFAVEPAKENILFGHERLVVTPHLGASTSEAQENVAIDVASQISNYLNNGVIENSINIASVSAADAGKLQPYLTLADQLGSFAGQITETAIKEIKISYHGEITQLNTKPVTATIIKSILSSMIAGVNIVNSQAIAKNRNITINESIINKETNYSNFIKLELITEKQTRSIAGTIFAKKPRIVEVNEIFLEATLSKNMLYVKNKNKPGLIGEIGKLLGDNNINISNFHLGKNSSQENEAIALIQIDSNIEENLLKDIAGLDKTEQVKFLSFN
jgi:D-3-phosphoglycerate dehydrogenase / 2-oxoglutarate reductase